MRVAVQNNAGKRLVFIANPTTLMMKKILRLLYFF